MKNFPSILISLFNLQSKIHELKKAKSDAQLLSTLLDPALNLMFERLKKEVLTSREKVEQMQNELAAWTFTPDRYISLTPISQIL